jgi:N6-adenosine-specific RNA methylase IME4
LGLSASLTRPSPIKMKRYNIIYADPAWHYEWNKSNKRAITYSTMSVEDICALPVSDLAEKDCALFMWATFPKMREAFEVIEAWGFEYKTCAFVWVKTNPSGWGINTGMGYWTRSNAELCLFATRGAPKRKAMNVGQIIMSPRQEHSRKPQVAREKIVALMGDLPRVELFARRRVDGWDAWGNEVVSDLVMA